MGNCGSSGNPASSRSKRIDKQLKTDEKKTKTEVKLLLLGAGESGKSTVLKQMRLIHAAGFSASEKEAYRTVVFENVLTSMQAMLEAMDILRIEMHVQKNLAFIPLLQDVPVIKKGQPYPDAYLQPLKDLWNDEGVQEAYRQGNTFALNDNVA
ncbi:unnamed protein product [Umbelopsis vinacea]